MIPIKKDLLRVNLTCDSNETTNELYINNVVENSSWHTIGDESASYVAEDVEKVIKIETDLIDDCMWESRIDIAKDDANQSSSILSINMFQNSSSSNDGPHHECITLEDTLWCNVCKQTFDLEFDLKSHIEEHKQQAQNSLNYNCSLNYENTFDCIYCNETFDLEIDLKIHLDEEHREQVQNSLDFNYDFNDGDPNLEKIFDCNYCEKKFALEINLKMHLDEEHREEVQDSLGYNCSLNHEDINLNKQFDCNYCKENFALEIDLKNHIEKHNKEQVQNSLNSNCGLNDDTNLEKTLDCKENFALKIDLKNHVGKHKDQTQNSLDFNCDLSHKNTNMEKKFAFNHCEDNLALKIDQNNYIEKDKKQTVYLLDDNCDLNPINTNLEKTFDQNHDKKNFVLEFDQNNPVENKYKQTHTNYRSYKCNHCKKEFKLNFLLNRHIKKCHLPKNSNSVINMSECSICNNFVDEAHHDDHIKTHKHGTEKSDGFGIFLKLCKLNGVWHKLPKDNIFKCSVCFEECSSEIDLIEHMKVHKHNDNQTQHVDKSKSIQVSKLINNNLEIRDDIPLICEMCNLKFDKKENFDLHVIYCTKSSRHIWSKFLGIQNNVKVTFVCKVCGTEFDNSSLLENHKMSCKSYSCSFCKNTFNTKDLLSKHVDDCKEYNSIRSSSIHINETPIDDVCNQNVKNNCSLSIRKQNDHYKNVSVKKWSDLGDRTVDSNVSSTRIIPYNCIEKDSSCSPNVNAMKNSCLNMVKRKRFDCSNAVRDHKLTGPSSSNNLMVNNCSFNAQKETTLYINNKESNGSYSPGVVNKNEKIVQNKPHNLMMHGYNINIKKEMNPCTTVLKRNSFNQVNTDNINRPLLPEVLQHDMIGNENNIRIKQEKGLRISAAEVNSFNLTNVSNCQTISSEMSKKPMKKEPEDSESNEVDENIKRENIYFTIWKTSLGAGNISYNGNYKNKEQTLQNIVYECKLCKKSFYDLHSLAVHLSGHKECSMHECVVCNEKFDTVLLWTEHEKYHQQQVDLNSSQTLDNSNDNETYNVENISYLENTEFQLMTTTVMDNRINESSSSIKRRFKTSSSNVTPNVNNNVEKLRKYHSNPTLPHHISTNIAKSFPCKYCDRIFSGQGQLTNHEKSHTNPNKNKSLVQNTNNILKTIESTETQLNMQMENNMVDSISMELQQKKVQNTLPWAPKKFICHYCRKRFTKKCYWTNHVRFVHKINVVPKHTAFKKPASTDNFSNEIGSINNSEQLPNSSKLTESIKENTNNLSISPSTSLNNFSKNVNKSAYCTICQKQFAHIGALTSHMHVHSNRKPYKCQYCDRKFSMKGPYCIHERNHKNKIAFNNIEVQNSNPVQKSTIEDEQQIKKENYNSELLDNTMNDNSSCMNFGKRNRMWLVCDVCNKKFSNPPQLILHRKLHHEMVSPYVCNICNKSYKTRHLWNSHLISHHGRHINNNVKNDLHDSKLGANSLKSEQHSNIFKCGYCKKEYSLLYHLKRHLSLSKQCRRHCNRNVPEFTSNRAKESYKKSIRFECKICNKTYSTDYNRKVHIINIHKVAPILLKNYNENLNEQTQEPSSSTVVETPTPQELNIPNQKKRGRQPNPNNDIAFRCSLCGNCYSNKNNLTRHYNIIHLKINDSITCDICGKTFKYKYSYQEHYKTKHGIGLQAGTSTNIDLKNNMNKQVVTTDKDIITMQYSCSICKVQFADNILLQKHIETQHTVNKYKCNDCGQHFETNIILGQHIFENHSAENISNQHDENITNTSPQPLNNGNSVQCRICFKVLSSSSYLTHHMLLHSGDKPFKCDMCAMSFRFMPNLNIHKKKHKME